MPRDLLLELQNKQTAPQVAPRDLLAIQPAAQLQAQQPQPSELESINQSAPVQGILGAGDAMARALSAGLLKPKFGEGLAYDIGGIGGDIGSYALMGAPVGMALRGAALAAKGLEGAPEIAKGLESLSGEGKLGAALRRTLGASAYGAYTTPENRGLGAAEGAGLGALFEAPGSIVRGIGSISRKYGPQSYAKGILEGLSSGSGPQANAESAGADIRNLYNKRLKESKEMYKDFHANYASQLISDLKGSDYYNLPERREGIFKDMYKDLPSAKEVHNKYMKNPTLENAHTLQSKLGKEIGSLKGAVSAEDRALLDNVTLARNSLKKDITNHLMMEDPTGRAAGEYTEGSDHFLKYIVPIISNSTLNDIAKGNLREGAALLSAIPNIRKSEHMESIANDLGEDFKNKMVFSELGKITNLTPEKLASGFEALDKKGFSSYITPSLEEQMDTLKSKVALRNLSQLGLGALTGLKALHPLSTVGQIATGTVGAGIAPMIARNLSKTYGAGEKGGLYDKMSRIYHPLTQSIIASLLNR